MPPRSCARVVRASVRDASPRPPCVHTHIHHLTLDKKGRAAKAAVVRAAAGNNERAPAPGQPARAPKAPQSVPVRMAVLCFALDVCGGCVVGLLCQGLTLPYLQTNKRMTRPSRPPLSSPRPRRPSWRACRGPTATSCRTCPTGTRTSRLLLKTSSNIKRCGSGPPMLRPEINFGANWPKSSTGRRGCVSRL